MTTTPFEPSREEPLDPDPAGDPAWGEPVDPDEPDHDPPQDLPDPS